MSFGKEARVKWRDGWVGELGLEESVKKYAEHLVQVMNTLKRVLKSDGSLLVNIDDSYLNGNTPTPFYNNTGELINVSGWLIGLAKNQGGT